MDARGGVADFQLRVLTPMGEVLNTRVSALRVTAVDGQLGVMARHAPMIARLQVGSAVVTLPEGEKRWLATIGGVLRVKGDEVVMIVDAAEEAEKIDVARAQRALERAEQRLADHEEQVDIARAELAVARAAARLKVAERGRPPE